MASLTVIEFDTLSEVQAAVPEVGIVSSSLSAVAGNLSVSSSISSLGSVVEDPEFINSLSANEFTATVTEQTTVPSVLTQE